MRSHATYDGSGAVIVMDAPKELGGCIVGIMGIVGRSMDIDIPGVTATITKDMANAARR